MTGGGGGEFLSLQGQNICRHIDLPICRTAVSPDAFQPFGFRILSFFFQNSSLTEFTVLMADLVDQRGVKGASSRGEGWRAEVLLTSFPAFLILTLLYFKLFLQASLNLLKCQLVSREVHK